MNLRKCLKSTPSRVGLDEVEFDIDIVVSEMISEMAEPLIMRCGSQIRARNVGCAEYPRSIPNFICNFSIFHMKYFWLKIRMIRKKKKMNRM
jgi:hypothetical protein